MLVLSLLYQPCGPTCRKQGDRRLDSWKPSSSIGGTRGRRHIRRHSPHRAVRRVPRIPPHVRARGADPGRDSDVISAAAAIHDQGPGNHAAVVRDQLRSLLLFGPDVAMLVASGRGWSRHASRLPDRAGPRSRMLVRGGQRESSRHSSRAWHTGRSVACRSTCCGRGRRVPIAAAVVGVSRRPGRLAESRRAVARETANQPIVAEECPPRVSHLSGWRQRRCRTRRGDRSPEMWEVLPVAAGLTVFRVPDVRRLREPARGRAPPS